MSRRKIRTKPKMKKPHFFEKDQWMRFTDGRAKSRRRRAKKIDTSPTAVEEDELEEKEYKIPAPEKEESK